MFLPYALSESLSDPETFQMISKIALARVIAYLEVPKAFWQMVNIQIIQISRSNAKVS